MNNNIFDIQFIALFRRIFDRSYSFLRIFVNVRICLSVGVTHKKNQSCE